MTRVCPKLLVLTLAGLLAACGPTPQNNNGGGGGGGGCTQVADNVTSDTTWPAGCYDLARTIDVSATLTLEPGVQVSAAQGTGIGVSTGTLKAVGTASKPIIFKGTGAKGSWQGVFIGSATANTLDYVTLADGGGGRALGALAIGQYGTASIQHSTVKNSGDDGINVDAEGVLTAFAANTLTGNTGYPIAAPASQLPKLDAATAYTGNGTDAVHTWDTFDAKCSVHDLGVPYHLEAGDNLYVAAPVTIEPGVTFDMGPGTWIGVLDAFDSGAATDGTLKAVGTPNKMITFHGDGTPGYWYQLQFGSASPDNVLSYVKVVDAGQDPTNQQTAIAMEHAAATVTVTHSVIGNNKGYAFCNPNGTTGGEGVHLDSPDSNTYSPPNGNAKTCP